jgi:cytidyltransferase-like protein
MDSPDARPGKSRIYVDMVGDLFHAGHVALLRAARSHGDWLIVGVLSDDTAASYKRRPIMSLSERVAVIESCRYVDEVVAGAPYRVTEEFLAEHAITAVVHGDEMSPRDRGIWYGPIAAAGKLKLVHYTAGISTTDLIRRVLEASPSSLRPVSQGML